MNLARKILTCSAAGFLAVGMVGGVVSPSYAGESESINSQEKVHIMDPAGPSEEVLNQATDEQLAAYYKSLEVMKDQGVYHQDFSSLGSFRIASGSPNAAKFSEGVKCIFQVGPIDCYTAKNDANTAYAAAEELYPDSLHNGPGDAFRHCYWNALMTIHINKDQAKIVADNHEEISNGPEAENRMDYKNNEIGREIGEGAPNEEAAKNGCIDAVNNGRLQLQP